MSNKHAANLRSLVRDARRCREAADEIDRLERDNVRMRQLLVCIERSGSCSYNCRSITGSRSVYIMDTRNCHRSEARDVLARLESAK